MADREEWTPEELLAELRARERARVASSGAAAPGIAGTRAAGLAPLSTAATGVVPRFRKLADLSSGELVRMVNERQRAIYGVDDRKDTYATTNKRALPLIDASLALVESADLSRTPEGTWSLKTSSYKAA